MNRRPILLALLLAALGTHAAAAAQPHRAREPAVDRLNQAQLDRTLPNAPTKASPTPTPPVTPPILGAPLLEPGLPR